MMNTLENISEGEENSKGNWKEWIPFYGIAKYYSRLIKEDRTSYNAQSSDEERKEFQNKVMFHGLSGPFIGFFGYVGYSIIKDLINNR